MRGIGARKRGAALAAMAAMAVSICLAGPTSASAGPISVQTVHIDTLVGPKRDTHCDIVADLYRPESATRRHPVPAILTTNGFGGSKDDQADIGRSAASRGYVVLSYSGLGFGGSGCRIQLDSPAWDGAAASQLITFLGGGSRAKDGTKVDFVALDRRAHDGRRHRFDPRVGMVGGSYGGQVQFAAASVDPRLDTIVPMITWNDLAYSLVPNNTDFTRGVTSATPGVPKWIWAALFFSLGQLQGIEHLPEDASRISGGCPNFDPRVCPAFVTNAALNTPNEQTLQLLREASVASYMNRITIPTLLMQGQGDTLFNLNESVATYEALRRRGVPVKLIWQSWGHSDGSPAPGEFGGDDPFASYQGGIVLRWFNHYLRDRGRTPSMDFCYFRDWVDYGADSRAGRAYACTDRYPAGSRNRLYLSRSGSLVGERSAVESGASSFIAPPEVPGSYTEVSALDQSLPPFDVPGTATSFTSAPLESPLHVSGIPRVRVTVDTALQTATEGAGDPGSTVLFFKLVDVAPNGDETLVHRLLAPVRVSVPDEPLQVEMPGIVRRFEAGHSIRLTVSGSDLAYRGNISPQSVTISTDPAHPGVLSLPLVGAGR